MGKNKKVLIVEDDSFLRGMCVKELVAGGYEVHEAIDGEEALKKINELKPDVILLDIILPLLNGFDVLKKIRTSSDRKIKKVPIIIISNLGQEDDVKKAHDFGANDYLIKADFSTEDIVKKLKQYEK